MLIIRRDLLFDFYRKHPDAKSSIEVWISITEKAVWKLPQDVTNTFAKASILKGRIVIFDIRGNDYRLEVEVSYGGGLIKVVWIGTHKEYDVRNKTR